MSRHLRACAAILAIVAVLFAPLAMALHACPNIADSAAHGSAMYVHDSAKDDMTACERHCSAVKQMSVLAKPLPMVSPATSVLHLPGFGRVTTPVPLPSLPAFLADPSPPFARFTVLRL